MKLIKQTKFGIYGDCLESCISSLTGVNVDDIPVYNKEKYAGIDYWHVFNKNIAKKFGFYLDFTQSDILSGDCGYVRPNTLCIALGYSGGQTEILHAVIWDAYEDELFFDPSPGNEGLDTYPLNFVFLTNYYNKQDYEN